MGNKVFTKEEWAAALEGLRDSYKIFVPAKDGDFHSFQPMENGGIPDFDFQNTRLSPKSLIIPQSERMFEYSLDKNDPEAHLLK